MVKLSKLVEERKEELIEALILRNVYKTSDHQHLYDAPLKTLEYEYKLVLKREESQ
ncbi:Fur-regulated basic protein FbpA [Bacillus sp. FJAT-18017]|uniref:Fur-regulated basic protein FbpA n=1 Tax=Bacillus sp. FJAT-18017 TaxID=1705566 RepID=UPI0009E98A8E|nr:Fur-regulated basic protein FbpA [Bacillus sp. FJAT-18017]